MVRPITTRSNLVMLALAPALAWVGLGGCAISRHPVPKDLVNVAQVPGMPEVRTWGDDLSPWFTESLENSARQEVAWYGAHPDLKMPATVDILTMSGGGQHGAFGAGLLCGWTEAGTRPEFKLVTGISTGALMSPWAFLGPKYDDVLRHNYTKTSVKDIYKSRGLMPVLFGASSLDVTTPLQKMVAATVDEGVLKAVAAEHAKGRRLLVGTTDLDAGRPVIWDMGAIASHGGPEALDLFRQVLVASASIPVGFNPQFVQVEANGNRFDEMHVDGGGTRQVFLWGAGFSRAIARRDLGKDYANRRGRLFVIRNGVVGAQYRAVEPRLLEIAQAAAGVLLQTDLVTNLGHLFMIAQQENAEFNLAFIPENFELQPASEFDTKYMDALFDLAFKKARAGYPWAKELPVNLPMVQHLTHE